MMELNANIVDVAHIGNKIANLINSIGNNGFAFKFNKIRSCLSIMILIIGNAYVVWHRHNELDLITRKLKASVSEPRASNVRPSKSERCKIKKISPRRGSSIQLNRNVVGVNTVNDCGFVKNLGLLFHRDILTWWVANVEHR